MRLRRDALVGTAKIIAALNDLASKGTNAPTGGTVGSLQVFPDSRNMIPEKVTFTIDLRDIDEDRRNAIETRLVDVISETAKQHGLAYHIRDISEVSRGTLQMG